MNTVEILTIGDELLRGELVDTNAAWLASRLAELGLQLRRISSVGDTESDIVAALGAAAATPCDVLVTGGLGPTDDDRTAAAVARWSDQPLERFAAEEARIALRLERSGLRVTSNNLKQARLPRQAKVLANKIGTAPGFGIEHDGIRVFCMPGVPVELKEMFDREVAPQLPDPPLSPAEKLVVKVFGLAESHVDARLSDMLSTLGLRDRPEVSLHYRATFPEIHVSLVVRSDDRGWSQEVLARCERAMRERLGEYAFAFDGASFAEVVVRTLRERRATLALAESCTGGLAGDLITRAAGSSEVFVGGVVAYDNRIKERLLGVSPKILQNEGAVSQACVEAMARGVRERTEATYAVAISGIAGPGGSQEDKPRGLVHFALVGPKGDLLRALKRQFPYARQRVKTLAAYIAHWLVYRHLCDPQLELSADPLAGRFKVD